MLPLDCIYQIALWTNFKTTISIIGSCKHLFSLRKQFYLEKQLLNNEKTINHWTPEENYYASTKDFTIFNITDRFNTNVNFHEVNYSLIRFLADDHHRLVVVAQLTSNWVCFWNDGITKYYDTLDDIISEPLYPSQYKPCYTKWQGSYYANWGTIHCTRGLSYDPTFRSQPVEYNPVVYY